MQTIIKQNKEIEKLEKKASFLGDMLFEAKHEKTKEAVRKRLIRNHNRLFFLYGITPKLK